MTAGEPIAPEPVAPESGRSRIYRSAAMAIAMQWAVRLIGLVSVILLARLLSPGDFGVIAVALTAAALVELFGWVGLRQALLRVREPERAHYDTAFTLQLIIFATLAAVLAIVMAPLAARFYHLPVLQPVLVALSVRFLCIATVNPGVIDFERNFQFERDLKMRVGGRLAALVVTLAAALILRNFWALVIGMIAQSAFYTISSYVAHPFRPRLSLAKRHELLGVSMWIFVSIMAEWVQNQIERLVLGRFGNPYTVGLYSTSKDLALIFTHEISTALNRVTFVTVAGSEGPIREHKARVATTMGAYAMLAAPLAVGLSATAHDTIAVLLGAKWLPATPFLQVIAIYTGIQAIYQVVPSVLQAAGKERRAGLMSLGGALLSATAVIAAEVIYRTPEAVAYAALGASWAVLLAFILVLSATVHINPLRIVIHIARPILAAAAMFLAVRHVGDLGSGSDFLDLVASVTLGAATYGAMLFLIWIVSGRPQGAESELLDVIARFVPAVRRFKPLV